MGDHTTLTTEKTMKTEAGKIAEKAVEACCVNAEVEYEHRESEGETFAIVVMDARDNCELSAVRNATFIGDCVKGAGGIVKGVTRQADGRYRFCIKHETLEYLLGL